MQLPRGRRRPIQQSSRSEGPFVYARLSDPILVKRAKGGDARDATQKALAKLRVKMEQFRGESQFATWLHGLTINACRDVANRQRARACAAQAAAQAAERERGNRSVSPSAPSLCHAPESGA